MTTALAFVAAGGALGSVARYLAFQLATPPWGTFGVNVLGSFLIGIAFVALAGRGPGQLFLVTGLLGGFTTFSAFSLDALRLVEDGRLTAACVYVLGTVVLSLLACLAGLVMARAIL
jgi:CrcB protein